jgi:hypothetical protein
MSAMTLSSRRGASGDQRCNLRGSAGRPILLGHPGMSRKSHARRTWSPGAYRQLERTPSEDGNAAISSRLPAFCWKCSRSALRIGARQSTGRE